MPTMYVKPSGVELLVNDELPEVEKYVKSLGWKKKTGPKPAKPEQIEVPTLGAQQLDSAI